MIKIKFCLFFLFLSFGFAGQVISGCGDSSGDSSEKASVQYTQQYWKDYCQLGHNCKQDILNVYQQYFASSTSEQREQAFVDAFQFTSDSCINTHVQGGSVIHPLVKSGSVKYHSDKADLCLQQIQSATCESLKQEFSQALSGNPVTSGPCFEVYEGTKNIGDSCTQPTECVGFNLSGGQGITCDDSRCVVVQ